MLLPRGSSQNGGNNPNWWFLPTSYKWDGSLSTSWDDPYNWDRGVVPQAEDTVIIRALDEDNANAPITNQPRLLSAVSVGNLTIRETNAYLDLNSYGLTVATALPATAGTLTNNGQLRLKGSENVVIEQPDVDSGTFYYYGDDTGLTRTITAGSRPTVYFNIQINDTFAAQDLYNIDKDITINGSFTLSDGQFDASSNSVDIGGSFVSNGSVFVAPGSGRSFTVGGNFTVI